MQSTDEWDDLPDVCFDVDAEGRWQMLSSAWTALTGHARATRLGTDCLADIVEDDRDSASFLLLNGAAAAGPALRDVRGEFRVRTATGAVIAFELHGRQRWDVEGRPLGTRGMLRHMTRVAALSDALTESEIRYRSLVAAMAEGVVLYRTDGRMATCNPAAERMLGLSLAQLQGRTPDDPRWHGVCEDGTPLTNDTHPVMVTLRTGTPLRHVIIGVQRPDGTRVWLDLNAQPMTDPASGLAYGVVTTFADVTASRTAPPPTAADGPDLQRIGYWTHDEVHRRLTWDDTCVELFGTQPHRMPGNLADWLARVHPVDQPRVLATHQQWKERGFGEILWPIYRIRTDSGDWRWIQSQRTVLEWTPEHTPARIAGTLRAMPAQFERQVLDQLVALCAWCKKVRSGNGMWKLVEDYFQDHLQTTLSHGMCPDCAERLTGKS